MAAARVRPDSLCGVIPAPVLPPKPHLSRTAKRSGGPRRRVAAGFRFLSTATRSLPGGTAVSGTTWSARPRPDPGVADRLCPRRELAASPPRPRLFPRSAAAHGPPQPSGHDALFQRIVFPCCRDGHIVNLYGRSINTAFAHRFLPGSKGGLFAWESVRQFPSVILVEGMFDLAVLCRQVSATRPVRWAPILPRTSFDNCATARAPFISASMSMPTAAASRPRSVIPSSPDARHHHPPRPPASWSRSQLLLRARRRRATVPISLGGSSYHEVPCDPLTDSQPRPKSLSHDRARNEVRRSAGSTASSTASASAAWRRRVLAPRLTACCTLLDAMMAHTPTKAVTYAISAGGTSARSEEMSMRFTYNERRDQTPTR